MTKEKAKEPQIRFKGFTNAWEQRKLGELADNTYGGGTPNTSNDTYWNGEIPWIQSSDLKEHRIFGVKPRKYISQSGLMNSATKLVPENSIAIITRVGVGKLAVMPFSYTTSQDFLSLSRIKTDIWFTAYLIYRKLQRELNSVQGTSIKGITKGELIAKMVSVPTKNEQVQIGCFFRNLDTLITLHQRKCDLLSKAKKTLLQKMFPKNGETTPEIRFKGFTGAWEQRKFNEWGTFYYGHSCPKWSVTEDATIPCIRYGELYTKFGNKIDKVYSYTNISPENLRFSKGTEVLIPRVGEDPMDYNHCTWLSLRNIAIGEMISVFNTEQDPLFSATMFNATLQKEFAVRVEGGSVTNLYFEKLKNIDISYPSSDEQKKIAAFFERLDHLITLHQHELEKLQNIKKSCLKMMFV